MRPPIDNYPVKFGYTFGVKTFYNDFHLGLDLIIPTGTPIFAPESGEVVFSVGNEGGNTILLKATKWHRFLHLQKAVKTGSVNEGDLIAYSNNTGVSTGPHCHWDIREPNAAITDHSKFIDPQLWLREQGDEVTNEQAKLLIYCATQGHEPQGAERAFALGDITPQALANLRYGDDVIGGFWAASTGVADCPDSEKDHYRRDAQLNQDHSSMPYALGWYHDHVQPKLDALAAQLATCRSTSDGFSKLTPWQKIMQGLSELVSSNK